LLSNTLKLKTCWMAFVSGKPAQTTRRLVLASTGAKSHCVLYEAVTPATLLPGVGCCGG